LDYFYILSFLPSSSKISLKGKKVVQQKKKKENV